MDSLSFYTALMGLVSFHYLHSFTSDAAPSPNCSKFHPEPDWGHYSYEEDQRIQLDCMLDSHRQAVMQWLFNGHLLRPDNHIRLENQNQRLAIPDSLPSDTGMYTCLAESRDKTMCWKYTSSIFVTPNQEVSAPRIVDLQPARGVMEVQYGASVNLSCTFDTGDSTFTLQTDWLKNGTVLKDTDKTVWNRVLTKEGEMFLLTVNNVTHEDFGEYECVGNNSLGHDSRSIILKRQAQDRGLQIPVWGIVLISVGSVLTTAFVVTLVAAIRLRKRKYQELEWEEPDMSDFAIPQYPTEFDVFISYSSEDVAWIKNSLFKQLDQQGYKVCVDFKDFVPGMAVVENIIDAIYKSRKTIIVMSKNFLQSCWGQFELQQAHNRAIAQRKDILILVKLDDCKVPTKLMGKTFLDWSSPDVQPHFWERLTESIGQSRALQDIANTDDDKDEDAADTNNIGCDDRNIHDNNQLIDVEQRNIANQLLMPND